MAQWAYYCFHKLKLLPSEFDALPRREKAMVIAMIKLRIEAESEEKSKLERKSRSKRKR